jgi:Fe-S cluster assembly protein SufB
MTDLEEFRRETESKYLALPLPKWKQEVGGKIVYREELKYSDYAIPLPSAFPKPDTAGFALVGKGDYVARPLLECQGDPWLSGELFRSSDDKLELLALAGWKHGLFLDIPPGSSAFVKVELTEAAPFRLIIRVGQKASPEIKVSYFQSGKSVGFGTSLLQLYGEEGSRPTLNVLGGYSRVEFSALEGRLGPNSSARITTFISSGDYGRHVGRLWLDAGSEVKAVVGEYVSKNSFGDSLFSVSHRSASTSDVDMRAAVLGKGVLRGVTKIERGAVGSKANLQERVLMVGSEAKAVTSPSLDIYEKDVQAKHGSWAGRIGSNELFYLRSRGLNEEQAVALVLRGLFEPLLSVFPAADVLGDTIDG